MTAPSPHSVIGTRFARPEAAAKAAGRVRYVSDVEVPGMLDASVVRSPYPRARVLAVDTGEALAVPGVVGIYFASDLGEVH